MEVSIRYARVEGDPVVYRQRLVADLESGGVSGGESHGEPPGSAATRTLITLQPSTPVSEPKVVAGVTILEPGSPVVWFTFPGLWHDIGAFHRIDGTFTGLYANILTPVELGTSRGDGSTASRVGPDSAGEIDAWQWSTTDLMLDLWLGAGSDTPVVLDREEFQAARAKLAPHLVRGAEDELVRILTAHRNDQWPPPVVREWPLERALQTAGISRAE